MSNNKVTIINQVAGPMCIDIANSFYGRSFDTRLYTGSVEPTYAQVRKGIHITTLMRYRREKPLQRVFTWSFFAMQAFFYLLFSDKSRKLLIVSNPPIAPFLGWLMNVFFKQPYVILIYDIYPDALIKMGFISKNSFFDKLWSKLNVKAFRRADRIITLSKSMRNELLKYTNKKTPEIEIIPCWVDNTLIKPIIPKSKNWFAQEHKQVEKCTVLYSGNMGTTHDIESIVKAADQLKERDDIHFLIIGNGVKKTLIENMIKERKLKNVTLLPFQPPEVVPYSMSCGDIAIITTQRNTASLLIPSKTFYYLAAGNQLLAITNRNSELSKLISENNLGTSINYDEVVDTLVTKIIDLKSLIDSDTKKTNHLFSSKYGIHHASDF